MGPSTSSHPKATPGWPSFSAKGFCHREAPGRDRKNREASGRIISPASNHTSSSCTVGSGCTSNLPNQRNKRGGLSEYNVIGSDRRPGEIVSRSGINHLLLTPGLTHTE